MKISPRSVPFVAVVLTAILSAGALWKSWSLKQGNEDLRTRLAIARGEPGSGASSSSSTPSASSPAAELETEQAATARAQTRIEKAAARLGIHPDDEVKTHGRVEALAAEGLKVIAATAIMSGAESTEAIDFDAAIDAAKEQHATTMAWLAKSEAISELEREPKRIARLETLALQQALQFDKATADKVQAALETEFTALATQNLIRPKRPDDGQKEWYERRDAALTAAAKRVETHIPEARRKSFLVEQVMHLGTGIRNASPNGIPDLTFTFPGMPKRK